MGYTCSTLDYILHKKLYQSKIITGINLLCIFNTNRIINTLINIQTYIFIHYVEWPTYNIHALTKNLKVSRIHFFMYDHFIYEKKN